MVSFHSVVLAIFCSGFVQSQPIKEKLKCNLDQGKIDEIHNYQRVVNEIIALFITGEFQGQTYKLLAEITDTFGSRLVSSQAISFFFFNLKQFNQIHF